MRGGTSNAPSQPAGRHETRRRAVPLDGRRRAEMATAEHAHAPLDFASGNLQWDLTRRLLVAARIFSALPIRLPCAAAACSRVPVHAPSAKQNGRAVHGPCFEAEHGSFRRHWTPSVNRMIDQHGSSRPGCPVLQGFPASAAYVRIKINLLREGPAPVRCCGLLRPRFRKYPETKKVVSRPEI